METKSKTQEINAIQFKARMCSLTVLHVYSSNLEAIEAQINQLVRQAPKMFCSTPIVIDLEFERQTETPIAFPALIKLLRKFQMVPAAITNGTPEQEQMALKAGLAILPVAKHAATETAAVSQGAAKSKAKAPNTKLANTKVINQPVRSGQQIYAKDADLIILASVSHGAEIIADGNIHVYGALHGRAIAGASGDLNARIFCTKLDAELVSIAGIYSLSDDYVNKKFETPMQIFLENNHLLMLEL
ncbi:MAG: septum site-determining protein MinC [Gammaproteobacteria bacterium]|nr:septum site-determining protein MinC [Gammaproteobacteria bacterium]